MTQPLANWTNTTNTPETFSHGQLAENSEKYLIPSDDTRFANKPTREQIVANPRGQIFLATICARITNNETTIDVLIGLHKNGAPAEYYGNYQKTDSYKTKIKKAALPWLESFLATAKSAKSSSDIYPLVDGVTDLFRKGKIGTVDHILSDTPLKDLNVLSTLTILRSTFSAKHKLPHWNSFLQKAEIRIAELGENPEVLLKGLK